MQEDKNAGGMSVKTMISRFAILLGAGVVDVGQRVAARDTVVTVVRCTIGTRHPNIGYIRVVFAYFFVHFKTRASEVFGVRRVVVVVGDEGYHIEHRNIVSYCRLALCGTGKAEV